MDMHRAVAWCNRYFSWTLLLVAIVGAYVLFFNENSIMLTYQQEREIENLEMRLASATDSLEYYQKLNKSLVTDPQTMERVVREQYHMQRPGEEVYLFQ